MSARTTWPSICDVPSTGLELAFGHQVTQSPERRIILWEAAFEQYLIHHTHPVTNAGAQGVFVGLDQANIVIPRSLAGRGDVNVVLTVDGKTSNTVTNSVK